MKPMGLGARSLCVRSAAVAGLAAAFAFAVSPVRAEEALGSIDLRLSLMEVSADRDPGTARLVATLHAAEPVEGIDVELFRSSGALGAPASEEVDLPPLAWRRPGESEPLDSRGGLSVGRLEKVAAELTVPLPGAGLYEVVVKVRGRASSGLIATEAMVLVPLGMELPRPVEFEGAVEYPAAVSVEVSP